ncbi:hypothetical protein N9E26_01080 [bacterium]|nr:hypothetical protein [bacterium]
MLKPMPANESSDKLLLLYRYKFIVKIRSYYKGELVQELINEFRHSYRVLNEAEALRKVLEEIDRYEKKKYSVLCIEAHQYQFFNLNEDEPHNTYWHFQNDIDLKTHINNKIQSLLETNDHG